MVTLTIKNKIQRSLDKLLTDAGKVSAVPDNFIMQPDEFSDFINEMQVMTSATRASIEVVGTPVKENECFVLNRQIKSEEALTTDEVNKLVLKWACREFEITYAGVPIVPGVR